MNPYEEMLDSVTQEVPVIEAPLLHLGVEGYYRNGIIYIDSSIGYPRKREILAEEYGHYKTTCGNILHQTSADDRKQEMVARNLSAALLVQPKDILRCFESGYKQIWECAEFLEISVETFTSAVKVYANQFEFLELNDNYTLWFKEDGTVGVFERFDFKNDMKIPHT
ncbi:MAG: ImmA/IrrE family metallo-endopeptidase [Enterococcus sp.]